MIFDYIKEILLITFCDFCVTHKCHRNTWPPKFWILEGFHEDPHYSLTTKSFYLRCMLHSTVCMAVLLLIICTHVKYVWWSLLMLTLENEKTCIIYALKAPQ